MLTGRRDVHHGIYKLLFFLRLSSYRRLPFAGNGIQKAFYDNPNVLYISLHVYAGGKYYPGGDEGNWDHCGAGPGLGR